MATRLVVKAGETLTINPEFRWAELYDLFRMEDDSTILLQQDMTIKAIRSDFGTACRIIARGAPGKNGADAPAYPANQGSDCGTGKEGAHGGDGASGQQGFNVTIQSGLASVGELTIDAGGGNGGNGGSGQEGGKGGTGKCVFCRGGVGGHGGNGGNGGRGGNGGKIILRWTPLPSLTVGGIDVNAELAWGEHANFQSEISKSDINTLANIPNGHFYTATFGTGGAGSRPGAGGHGGDGVRCGILGKQGGGDVGTPGMHGKIGKWGLTTPYDCRVG